MPISALIPAPNNLAAGKQQQGFTLVEFLLYFALSTILITFITTLFLTILESRAAVGAVSEIERDAHYISARMRYDFYATQNVLTPSAPGVTSSSLVGEKPEGSYEYQVIDGRLHFVRSGENVPLHTETIVSEVSFFRHEDVGINPMVTASFTLTSPYQETLGQRERTFSVVLGAR